MKKYFKICSICIGIFIYVMAPLAVTPAYAEPTFSVQSTRDTTLVSSTDKIVVDTSIQKPNPSDSTKQSSSKIKKMRELPKDLTNAYITLIILTLAGISFFVNKIHPAVTAMLVACTISILGLVTPKEAFINFGETNVVTFIAFFILGEACFTTGFANVVGEFVYKHSRGNLRLLLVLEVLFFGALSAFMSNAGLVAMALPMVLGICRKGQINPGKLLMPLTFAASAGGACALIGTPPNLIANAAISELTDVQPFGFFEFGYIGVPLLLLVTLYYGTIGINFLPDTYPSPENLADAEERAKRKLRTEKMRTCLIIFGAVLICMVFRLLPLVSAAMLGAMLVVITGCLTMREAFRGIDWTTVFIMAGMMGLGTALDKTGAAQLVATKVVAMVSDPYAILAAVCLMGAFLSNLMSNAGCAVLLSPLVIGIAHQAGISPLPLVMGLITGISSVFMTPIGTPSNTMVYSAGNYTFMHFVKLGWPLQLISFVASMVIIPVVWPF